MKITATLTGITLCSAAFAFDPITPGIVDLLTYDFTAGSPAPTAIATGTTTGQDVLVANPLVQGGAFTDTSVGGSTFAGSSATPSGINQFSAFGFGQTISFDVSGNAAYLPVGSFFTPDSIIVVGGVFGNLSDIAFVGTIGAVTTFVPNSSAIPGIFEFDLSGNGFPSVQPDETTTYSLALVATNGAAPVTFSFSDVDSITLRGTATAIPEPSVYIAGISAIGLAGLVIYRRRKSAAAKEIA